MAGLGQYFNGPMGGLLNAQQKDDAMSMGLLNLGAGIMKNGGWQRMPVSTGQAIGGGLTSFTDGYNNFAKQAVAADELKTKRASATLAATLAKQKRDRIAAYQANPTAANMATAYPELYAKNQNALAVEKVKAGGKAPKVISEHIPGGLIQDWQYINGVKTKLGVPHKPKAGITIGGAKHGEKALYDRLNESRQLVSASIKSQDTVNRMSAALAKSNVGLGGTLKQSWDQVATAMNIGGRDAQERVGNTRNVIQGLAQMTLDSRKLLAGQGPISDNEQKVLEKAKSGQFDSMTKLELKILLDVTARANKAAYDQGTGFVNKMASNKNLSEDFPYIKDVYGNSATFNPYVPAVLGAQNPAPPPTPTPGAGRQPTADEIDAELRRRAVAGGATK